MHWNRSYKTLTPPPPGELFVAGVDQVPKETGSGHDTWLTYAGSSQDFGNDCLVQVCRLHPTLDGVQQVDKFKACDQQLAIRAPVYNDVQRQEICNAIAHSRPTVQKVRQASQDKILQRTMWAMIFCQQPLRRYCNQLVPVQKLPAQAYNQSQHYHLKVNGSILDLQPKLCGKYQSWLRLLWVAYHPHIKGPAVTVVSAPPAR